MVKVSRKVENGDGVSTRERTGHHELPGRVQCGATAADVSHGFESQKFIYGMYFSELQASHNHCL